MKNYLRTHITEIGFPSSDRSEVSAHVLEILHELGEASTEVVRLYGHQFCLINLHELYQSDCSYEIYYNYYERKAGSTFFLSSDPDEFSGLSAMEEEFPDSSITEEEPCCNEIFHYRAVLAAEVFCECCGRGDYLAFPDAGQEDLKRALSWIAKRYGNQYCETFLKQRMDHEKLWETCGHSLTDFEKLYWGPCDSALCKFLSLHLPKDTWDTWNKKTLSSNTFSPQNGSTVQDSGTCREDCKAVRQRLLQDMLQEVKDHPLTTPQYLGILTDQMLLYFHGQLSVSEETDLELKGIAEEIHRKASADLSPVSKDSYTKVLFETCEALYEKHCLPLPADLFYDMLEHRTFFNKVKLLCLKDACSQSTESRKPELLVALFDNEVLFQQYGNKEDFYEQSE